MARSKKRQENDEIEHLKSENRELKSKIKSLERHIKKLNKEYKTEYNQEDLIEEDHTEKTPKVERCPICTRGNIQIVELGVRKLMSCTVCDQYRKVIKNG